MTFDEKYRNSSTWHEKVTVMGLYHIVMTHRESNWTLAKTASYFEVSVGLVSENLKLAEQIHISPTIIKCETRAQALSRLPRGRYYGRTMETEGFEDFEELD